MKKSWRLVISLLICLCVALPMQVFAATVILNIDGKENVKVGETFTVNVSYSCEGLDSINGQIDYDTDSLEYISGGSSEGNGGIVQLRSNGEDGQVSFPVKFKALKEGSADLAISTNEAYNLDGEMLEGASATETISIAANQNNEGEEAPTTAPEEKPEEETPQAPEQENTNSENQNNQSGEKSITISIVFGCITAALLVIACVLVGLRKRRRKASEVGIKEKEEIPVVAPIREENKENIEVEEKEEIPVVAPTNEEKRENTENKETKEIPVVAPIRGEKTEIKEKEETPVVAPISRERKDDIEVRVNEDNMEIKEEKEEEENPESREKEDNDNTSDDGKETDINEEDK